MRFDMKVRIAILDMYEGFANQGMRGIKEIITNWGVAHHCDISYEVFDVRLKNELPDLSYDAYISTGGPGSPLDSEGEAWDTNFIHWIEKVEKWNSDIANYPKNMFFLSATVSSWQPVIIKSATFVNADQLLLAYSPFT